MRSFHKVTAREVVDYITYVAASPTGGKGGGVFVLREGSRAIDTYYEGGDGILIGWGFRFSLCVGWMDG